MTDEAAVRIRKRISTSELERRWKAVRQAMKERGLDFLIIQNSTAHFCGNVRWFTDMTVPQGYPVTVIFPVDDEMTIISHGARAPSEPGPPMWALRGIKKRLSVPIIYSMNYTTTYDAELVVTELSPYKDSRVGLVGTGFFSAAFYKYVTEHLTTVIFEDATDLVDTIKVIKSDEEISLIREACQMQDSIFKSTLNCIRPGRRDFQVRADFIHSLLEAGGEEATILVGSAPAGTAARPLPEHFSNRVIEAGDQVAVLLETSGPGGMWGEFGRIVCLGKIPTELQEYHELAQKTQKVTLRLLKPGADPESIWDANNAFLKHKGYPEERRIYAHGQGYDMLERPSLNPGETLKIQARMNIVVHPEVKSPRAYGWVCENYLVAEEGEAECLHKTPQKIFEV